MATFYLRMPADDDTGSDDSDPSAMLDDDSATVWTSSQPMTPGEAAFIDRGSYKGDGRYEDIIDGDSTTKWSTTHDITPGQAVLIDRGDPLKGIGDPASMLDDDAASRWTSGINMTPGIAVIIDRGVTNVHLFNQVVMDSGTNVNDYARSYTISVSDNNTTWTQVASGTTSGVTAAPIIATAEFSVRFERYVKITQTGTASHWWSLASVRVRYIQGSAAGIDLDTSNWGISVSGISASLPVFNRIVMNSGTGSDNYARSFAVAVSTNKTSWTTIANGSGATPIIAIGFADQHAQYMKIVQSSAAADVWTLTDIDLSEDTVSLDRSAWTVDVEGNVGPLPEFDQIVMNSGTNTTGYARRFDIYVSTNGSTWTQVTTGVGASGVVASARFTAQTTRYIKIVQNSTAPSYWSLASVTAFNNGQVLGRTAWEASVSTAEPVHGSDYWLPISVNAECPTGPDPMNTLDDSPSTWFTRELSVATGYPLLIDRGSDTTAFNNVLVYFGAPLAGQLGWDPANDRLTTRFQILVSADKVTWTWVATAYAAGQALAVLLDQPQVARYIQIVLMEGLTESWTVTRISLFDGDTPLSRIGWTVTTAFIGSGGGIERALLRLNASGWVDHLPPTAINAKPLQLKAPDNSWKTVMYLGIRDGDDAPNINCYTRRITLDDSTGIRYDDVWISNPGDADMPYLHPGWTTEKWFSYQSSSHYLYVKARIYSEWRRERINDRPTGDQMIFHKEHEYQHSTVWFTQMDRVRRFWSGFPVKKLRFGFQIQTYSWDAWHIDEKPTPPSPGTFLIYREPVVPPQATPPMSVTGTPIYTFSPVSNWTYNADSRGEMFWYEIDPVWHDIAFTVCTMWEAFGLTPPLLDPSTGATPLPSLADGFYEYQTTESAFIKYVFQVVLDD